MEVKQTKIALDQQKASFIGTSL